MGAMGPIIMSDSFAVKWVPISNATPHGFVYQWIKYSVTLGKSSEALQMRNKLMPGTHVNPVKQTTTP